MRENDLERRVAALEQNQRYLEEDLARMEQELEEARRPNLWFVARVGLALLLIFWFLQMMPGLMASGPTGFLVAGGPSAVWGSLGILMLTGAVMLAARRRAGRKP
ncbi:hypothetical protein [Streptomyces sp. NPDC047108]|uniref:hypothetical protein n=1 Tax=Streptomyces sp. NPDC047108 TaxID=3155025 RepID=UPI0033E450B3